MYTLTHLHKDAWAPGPPQAQTHPLLHPGIPMTAPCIAQLVQRLAHPSYVVWAQRPYPQMASKRSMDEGVPHSIETPNPARPGDTHPDITSLHSIRWPSGAYCISQLSLGSWAGWTLGRACVASENPNQGQEWPVATVTYSPVLRPPPLLSHKPHLPASAPGPGLVPWAQGPSIHLSAPPCLLRLGSGLLSAPLLKSFPHPVSAML